MSVDSIKDHHQDAAATPGLPAPLPEGETLLWQGSPQFMALARTAFHLPALVVYFAAILALRGFFVFLDSHSMLDAVLASVRILPLFAAAVAMVCALAWLTCRTTVYTITSKRVVMQIGVVLDLTFNLPFSAIEGVGLKLASSGAGDLPVQLGERDKIAYLHLWPHARPWQVARPEPMMRAVADAALVAELLGEALRKHLAVEGAKKPNRLPALEREGRESSELELAL